MPSPLFTIGHSNHPFDRFLELLRLHHITTIADVRSNPYSRHNPQFNRETLKHSLQQAGIEYLFLGSLLGARSSDPSCCRDGAVQFSLVARTKAFQQGLGQVRSAAAAKRLALMCAEKDPLQCHRAALICRNLRKEPFPVVHILADGSLETREELEGRLLSFMKVVQDDLFLDHERLIERAYDLLSDRMSSASPVRNER